MVVWALILALAGGCATFPQHKVHQSLQTDRAAQVPKRLVLLPPDVRVYELSSGGLKEEVPEWSALARQNVLQALRSGSDRLGGLTVLDLPALPADRQATLREHQALYEAVASNALLVTQLLQDPAWQHKNREFDYGLGEGLRFVADQTGADAALLIHAEDAVSTAGRIATAFVLAALGVGIPMGYSVLMAGVVDLQTGDLLWLNYAAIPVVTDLRKPEDAAGVVNQVFRDYPGLEAWRKASSAAGG